MSIKLDNGLEITELQIWPMRNPEASRVKAMVSITFNDSLRVSNCRIIEGAKGLFLSYPCEKKPGTDQYIPIFLALNRRMNDKIQEEAVKRFTEPVQ